MDFAGIDKFSLLDYDENVSVVLFLNSFPITALIKLFTTPDATNATVEQSTMNHTDPYM